MKNLEITLEQIKEIDLLMEASKHLLTESVEGVAQVAKRIQVYLGCTFKKAVKILRIFLEEA